MSPPSQVGEQSLLHLHDHISRGQRVDAEVEPLIDLEKMITSYRGKKQM